MTESTEPTQIAGSEAGLQRTAPRLMITGLCFQGNLGGPALALSLADGLQRSAGNIEFVFAVPGGAEFELEEQKAREYGYAVVPSGTLKHLLPPHLLKAQRRKELRLWTTALRSADLVIDMTALTYVSPPAGSVFGALNGRFFTFGACRVMGIPFLAWTQTYGPFDNIFVRSLARMDLGRLPRVYCRGEATQASVRRLLPEQDVLSFPDVACSLEPEAAGIADQGADTPGYISLSPSSVIYSATGGVGTSNDHVTVCAEMVRRACSEGYRVMLVPHTVRQLSSAPEHCDRAVARLIIELAAVGDAATLVEDPGGPRTAKRLIGGSVMHIGARYHSLVAALSSAVPAISIAWHHKYRDLMREYGCEDLVFDALASSDVDSLWAMIETVLAEQAGRRAALSQRQSETMQAIDSNLNLFARDIADLLDKFRP